MEAKRSVTRN